MIPALLHKAMQHIRAHHILLPWLFFPALSLPSVSRSSKVCVCTGPAAGHESVFSMRLRGGDSDMLSEASYNQMSSIQDSVETEDEFSVLTSRQFESFRSSADGPVFYNVTIQYERQRFRMVGDFSNTAFRILVLLIFARICSGRAVQRRLRPWSRASGIG